MLTLPLPALSDLNPVPRVRDVLGWLGNAEGRPHRRSTISADGRHAHIEVRGAHRLGRAELVHDVKVALEALHGVDWAEVDTVVGRAVVVFDPETVNGEDLIGTIEAVEQLHGATGERFPHDRPDHPADREPIQRNVFAVIADVLGVGVATGVQVLRVVRIPAEVPGLISLADSQPRLRRFLENRLGRPATDVMLVSANALSAALSQGPLGLVVDISHRAGLIGELQARRAVWQRQEPELVAGRESLRRTASVPVPRPVPLPDGPIERYTDRAAIGSLGAVGVALGATLDPRRASDLLLAGIPKAATMGREAFAAFLDRELAAHGVITMDPAALRRLDRVDALVLEAQVATSKTWSIDDVVTFDEHADLVECTLLARTLFDPKDPLTERSRGAWTLAPLTGPRALPDGATIRGRRMAAGGRRVVGLWRGDDLRAFVAVLEEPVPLAEELVELARDAGLELFLAGGTDAFAARLGIAQGLIVGQLVDELRGLQRAGRVTMLVAGHDPAPLRIADVGLGVVIPGKPVPWDAHLVIGEGLSNAWRVDRRTARRRAPRADEARCSRSPGHRRAASGRSSARAVRPRTGHCCRSMRARSSPSRRAASPVSRPGGVRCRAPGRDTHGTSSTRMRHSVSWKAPRSGSRRRNRRAAARAARPGSSREPVGLVRAAVDELANPLTPLLALGAAMSAAVGSITDAGLVSGVVCVNALVGAAQRVQTERSLLVLEENGGAPVRVRIRGELRELPPDRLVVGDVIELAAGDTVPADCRLLETVALEVDESAMTGESLPVAKAVPATPGAPVAERTSMLYDGSSIAAGRAVALVVAVGRDTESGRSEAAAAAPPPSGVEVRLATLTRLTVPVTLAGGAIVTGLGFLYRRPARAAVGCWSRARPSPPSPKGSRRWRRSRRSPRRAGSPPATCWCATPARSRRSAGSTRSASTRRAHSRTGPSRSLCVSDGSTVERLDALSVRGRAVLSRPRCARHPSPKATTCSRMRLITRSSSARLRRGSRTATDSTRGTGSTRSRSSRDAVTTRCSATRATETRWVTMKGAPEVVVPLADTWRRNGTKVPLVGDTRDAIDDHVEQLGRRGLRVLAVAEAPANGADDLGDGTGISGLELVGFVALADLVRPTAAAAVQDLNAAGVDVAMITGDHPSTAEAIAAELGLLDRGRVLTGPDLDRLTDDELDELLPTVSVFARVTPLQKVRIVEAYQRAGRSVAMTGDGANDAAAIRLADAGIALGGRGTAAARAAADIVVVDDRIETIVDAIVEGRSMWDSVRDAVAILVGGNLGELGFILVGAAATGTSPLNPRQLLLVNLLTDMAPALAIALREPPDLAAETLLHAGPDASLGRPLAHQIAVRAGATATGATVAWVAARMTGTPTRARTVALAALVGTQLGQTLVVGGRSPLVLGATAVSAAALVVVVETPGLSQFFGCRPLGPVGWLIAVGSSVGATGASIAVPRVIAHLGERIRTSSRRHGTGLAPRAGGKATAG